MAKPVILGPSLHYSNVVEFQELINMEGKCLGKENSFIGLNWNWEISVPDSHTTYIPSHLEQIKQYHIFFHSLSCRG